MSSPRSKGIAFLGYFAVGGVFAALSIALLELLAAPAAPTAKPAPSTSRPCLLSASPAACDRCMLDSCLASCQACAQNVACLGLFDCLMDCRDAECEGACALRYPEGRKDLAAFVGQGGCLVRNCSAQCP